MDKSHERFDYINKEAVRTMGRDIISFLKPIVRGKAIVETAKAVWAGVYSAFMMQILPYNLPTTIRRARVTANEIKNFHSSDLRLRDIFTAYSLESAPNKMKKDVIEDTRGNETTSSMGEMIGMAVGSVAGLAGNVVQLGAYTLFVKDGQPEYLLLPAVTNTLSGGLEWYFSAKTRAAQKYDTQAGLETVVSKKD